MLDDLRWTSHLLPEDWDTLINALQKPVFRARVIVELSLRSGRLLATSNSRIDKLVLRKDVPIPLRDSLEVYVFKFLVMGLSLKFGCDVLETGLVWIFLSKLVSETIITLL